MNNNFAQLDAQSETSAFATFTPTEHEEYQSYLDERDSHGTPGDGSGEDDLADLMAHGDEGCCDGPEDFADDGPECDDAHEAEDSHLEAFYEDRFDTDYLGE